METSTVHYRRIKQCDSSDCVRRDVYLIVTNVEKVKFTGNKLTQKRYTWYTGYPGLHVETAENRLRNKPEMILREAVRRMLPKNKLGRKMLSKLKLYVGPDHPHQSQTPEPAEFGVKK